MEVIPYIFVDGLKIIGIVQVAVDIAALIRNIYRFKLYELKFYKEKFVLRLNKIKIQFL